MSNDYWEECLAQSCEEHGVAITQEQIVLVAADIDSARDCYSQYHYQPENPLIRELSETKSKLQKEQEKVGCRVCNGSGREQYRAGVWFVDSQCSKCNGEGKHAP